MNINKTKMMFHNYILDHEIKIEDGVISCVQKYIYYGQKFVPIQNIEKIKRTTGTGWNGFGRQNYDMKSNLPRSLKRKDIFNSIYQL